MSSPTFHPNSYVIFSLIPMNDAATQVVNSPLNNHLFNNQPNDEKKRMIDIIFDPSQPAGLVPCVIGQTGNIIINRIGVANFYCSFSIHVETGEILLVDHSPSRSLKFNNKVRPYVNGIRPDAVVIDRKKNKQFSFGGRDASWFQWRIFWHKRPPIDVEAWAGACADLRVGQTGTIKDFPPTQRLENSQAEDRFLHRKTLAERKRIMKVTKAVDAFSGQYVAIKKVNLKDPFRRNILLEEAGEFLTEFDHPHIIEFLQVEIQMDYFRLVMDLQDGDVQQLALEDDEFRHRQFLFKHKDKVGRPLLHQMLLALDYLASKRIIHRDVKPQNILYRRINGSLHYRLADFGLATTSDDMLVQSGTYPFQAPEVMFNDPKHTPKIDVWSLCATLIWAFNLGAPGSSHKLRFFVSRFDKARAVENEIQSVAQLYGEDFASMAKTDIQDRKSAAELLHKIFPSVGRA